MHVAMQELEEQQADRAHSLNTIPNSKPQNPVSFLDSLTSFILFPSF